MNRMISDITTEQGRTDLSNAERFAAQHTGQLLYCKPMRRWLVWDGQRWLIDDADRSMTLAMDTARSMMGEAVGQGSEVRKFACYTASRRGMESMIALAGGLMPVAVDQLNRHPFLLNCPNGTLDLRTGELRPHDPDDMLTAICPTAFDPAAESPEWESFLTDITCGDDDLVKFHRQFAGMCLTGCVDEHVIAIFYGGGGNGKGTLMNLLMETLGGNYAMQATQGMLMMRKHDAHSTETADLFGMRMLVSAETHQDQKLDEAKVKALTGGDRIRARKCHKDHFEFAPTHKLILQTNHKPRVEGTDHGIWRRMRLVPFNAKFEGAGEDVRLKDRLLTQREAILSWAVKGCLEWRREGRLCRPSSVAAATDEYRQSEDKIGEFIRERCNRTGEVKLSEFTKELSVWSGTTWTSRAVGAELRNRKYEDKTNNGTWFTGLSLS